MKRFADIPSDKKLLYIISIAFFCLPLILLLILPMGKYRIVSALIFAAAAAIVFVLVKKRSALSIRRWQVLFLVATSAALYMMIYYLTGTRFGFVTVSSRLSLSSYTQNIIPIAIMIIAIEIIRAVLLAQKNTFVSVMTYFGCAAADLLIFGNGWTGDFNGFMQIAGMIIIPALASGLLFNYLSANHGIYPNIAYRFITVIIQMMIPIEPALPDALKASMRLFTPLLILLFIRALYEKRKTFVTLRRKTFERVVSVIGVVVMISIVMLISGQFFLGLVVIGSGSMTGELDIGDAAIFEKYDGEKIEVGQVIVFNRNNTKVIHRVIQISTINGQTRYYTKGDANPSADAGYIVDSDIVGVVRFKVQYIGYPSLWLRQLIE